MAPNYTLKKNILRCEGVLKIKAIKRLTCDGLQKRSFFSEDHQKNKRNNCVREKKILGNNKTRLILWLFSPDGCMYLKKHEKQLEDICFWRYKNTYPLEFFRSAAVPIQHFSRLFAILITLQIWIMVGFFYQF
jgi:hypothetical protein